MQEWLYLVHVSENIDGLLHHSAAVQIQGESTPAATEAVHYGTVLLTGAILKELLNDVVTKHVCAELSYEGTDLLESHLLLHIISLSNPLLQEPRAILICCKCKDLTLNII